MLHGRRAATVPYEDDDRTRVDLPVYLDGKGPFLFELDNGTMSQARLAKEVWDYERYAGHRVWEGARGTIGGT